MAKLTAPLLSFFATGSLAKRLSFRGRGKTTVAESYPFPKDARSTAQLSWRHMYQKAIALWHALSSPEKAEWEALARPRHMTGYALFISSALKPNPGLYLPLQGGTMQGDIDMAGNALKGFYTSPEQTFARIYRDGYQSIPPSTWTKVLFNTVHYDTQAESDLANNRILIKAPNRRFILGCCQFPPGSVEAGHRFGIGIKLNGDWISSSFFHSSISATMSPSSLSPVFVSAGDIIDMWVHHNMEAAVDMTGTLYATWLAVY